MKIISNVFSMNTKYMMSLLVLLLLVGCGQKDDLVLDEVVGHEEGVISEEIERGGLREDLNKDQSISLEALEGEEAFSGIENDEAVYINEDGFVVVEDKALEESDVSLVLAQYYIDTKKSVLEWKGSAIGKSHNGVISLDSGDIQFSGGVFQRGEVIIDMKSITTTDLKGKAAAGLDDHLKGADFFAVDQYPQASIILKEVEMKEGHGIVLADLVIKGILHEISFPATYKETEDGYVMNADITIDRTKWDVEYKSGSVFKELKDDAISDDIELSVSLVAVPAPK